MDLGGIIGIAASTVTVLGAGAYVGRASAGFSRKHKAERDAKDRADAEAEDRTREMMWLLTGKPATPFEAARPGLSKLIADQDARQTAHAQQDSEMFARLNARMDVLERRDA